MLEIVDGNINITRGNMLPLTIKAQNIDGSWYTFKQNDVIRFNIINKRNFAEIVLSKDFVVQEDTISVDITISADDMKIGEIISKPFEYAYEVELNPDTENTQTIVGYTKEKGAKILTLLPEGGR